MKRSLSAIAFLSVIGFIHTALASAPATASGAQPDTETVLVTHRVQAGKEAEYLKLLARQWAALTKHKLVLDNPHMVLRGEEGGKPFFVEIFSWVSHDAPENVP